MTLEKHEADKASRFSQVSRNSVTRTFGGTLFKSGIWYQIFGLHRPLPIFGKVCCAETVTPIVLAVAPNEIAPSKNVQQPFHIKVGRSSAKFGRPFNRKVIWRIIDGATTPRPNI